MSPETLRGHTLKFGEQLRAAAAVKPAAAVSAIIITLDATFIRGCHDGERHLEVRVGNVETSDGGRQVFGSVARADTDIVVLIRRSLETVGQTADTALTTFTDGCPGLQSILAKAGVTKPPIADWFHIAMRLQHAKQAASGLSTDEPGRLQAKAAIVAEVERLHWRIWNGKARSPQCQPRSGPPHTAPRPSSPSPLRSTQRASRRRNFTPAQPDSPATSLRDFRSGAYNSGGRELAPAPAGPRGLRARGTAEPRQRAADEQCQAKAG